MVEKPDQIERHIESTRSELGNHLQELEYKVKRAADWKTYFERSPFTLLGLAFGGGVLLAAMGGPRRAHTGVSRSEMPTWKPERERHSAASMQRSQVADTLDTLKNALIGFTALKVRKALDGALPGFGEEYEKAQRDRSSYGITHSRAQEREFDSAHKM